MDHQDRDILLKRVNAVRQQLADASGGKYPPPRLIAVSKTQPAERIALLKGSGISDLGENRVQEIQEKWPLLGENFRFHQIGRLQTNKVKYIIEKVCLIQSLDRLSLAQEIDRQSQKHHLVTPVLLQVSPAAEPQKGGAAPEDVRTLLKQCAQLPGLHVRGLMAIMPNTQDEAYLSRLFGEMRMLFDQLREEDISGVSMEELSMGMSGDYLLAARHGATMVRIGSAIFGPRTAPAPEDAIQADNH